MPHRLTALPVLPEPLAALGPLAHGLAAEWDDALAGLFRALAPDAGATAPLALLAAATPARLTELAADQGFVDAVAAAVARESERLGAESWYATLPGDRPRAIAYLSPEFGVSDALPQYSGGLGVLAGDHLKAASDLGVPIVAVGLFYRNGYFRQHLTASGEQRETFDALDPAALPMRRAVDPAGEPVGISVQLPGVLLHAAVWQVDVGRVPLYLLDTDVPENGPAERAVTDRLYGGDREHRLRQEILLGIGGREGARRGRRRPRGVPLQRGPRGLPRHRAPAAARRGAGPRADGGDRGGPRARRCSPPTRPCRPASTGSRATSSRGTSAPAACPSGLPIELLLSLGSEPGGDPAVFNMAALGIRLSARINGVSRLHGQVARGMFAAHFPGFAADEVPIGHITNGVHAETWTGPEFAALYRRAHRRRLRPADARLRGASRSAPTTSSAPPATRPARGSWHDVRRRLRATWSDRGIRDGQLAFARRRARPATRSRIGFARRVPTYKRLTLMLRDPERLERLLLDAERPVQIVIAGKAHPDDAEGKSMIAALGAFAARPELRHRIVILADYDMAIAPRAHGRRRRVAQQPAAAVRGVRDERHEGGAQRRAQRLDPRRLVGRALRRLERLGDPLGRRRIGRSGAARRLRGRRALRPAGARDRRALLRRPSRRWLQMVRHTVSVLAPDLLASRMLRDYVGDLYAPAAAESRRLSADGHAGARRLGTYGERVRASWSGVDVVRSEVGEVGAAGADVAVRALVRLGGLEPGELSVEGVVDAEAPFSAELEPGAEEDGGRWFEGSVRAVAGSATLRIRVLPRHADLEDPRTLGLVAQDDD